MGLALLDRSGSIYPEGTIRIVPHMNADWQQLQNSSLAIWRLS